ncbi:hypothetical protein K7432_009958 [Basidiobolus ranarum]|uniref:Uncharacterized protein n=1 Tax=Basidiobolus ranarum TaxID=34480 RepID=A0ABR2VWN5_9FUNG
MITFQETNLRKRLLGQDSFFEVSQPNKRQNTCQPDPHSFHYSSDSEILSPVATSPHTSSHDSMEYLNLIQARSKDTEPIVKSVSGEVEGCFGLGALSMDVDRNSARMEEQGTTTNIIKTSNRPDSLPKGQKVLVFGFQKDCSKCQRAVPGHYSHIMYRQ